MHIFLVGMTGAGKSSLGRYAAQEYGLRYFDNSDRISALCGNMPVRDIIRNMGDEFVSGVETGVLIQLAGEVPRIVSTGSSCCLLSENISIMRNHGIIVFVDRPLDRLLADHAVPGDQKKNIDHEEMIYQYKHNIGFYKAAADYTVKNGKNMQSAQKSLSQIVNYYVNLV